MYRNNLSGEMAFKSFLPTPLSDIQIIHTEKIDNLIRNVEKTIYNLNTYSDGLSEKQIQQLIKQEAEYSCRLALDGLLLPFEFTINTTSELEEDTKNLLQAIHYVLQVKEELPLSARMLKNAHYLICNNEKYSKKYPGDFRTSPIWIGKKGCILKDALFIPPIYEDMIEAFSELEHFINYNRTENVFIRAALIHYQFETIHPFIDANGRVGRLLNTLYLIENGIIKKPVLKWSEILWEQRNHYYSELQYTHETGIFENWIIFFLTTINEAIQRTLCF